MYEKLGCRHFIFEHKNARPLSISSSRFSWWKSECPLTPDIRIRTRILLVREEPKDIIIELFFVTLWKLAGCWGGSVTLFMRLLCFKFKKTGYSV
jgi:hypothetical protein